MRTRCCSVSAANECPLTYGFRGVDKPMCSSPWDNRGKRNEGTVENCWHWRSGGLFLIEFEVAPVPVFVLSVGRVAESGVVTFAIDGEASTFVNRSTNRHVQLEER